MTSVGLLSLYLDKCSEILSCSFIFLKTGNLKSISQQTALHKQKEIVQKSSDFGLWSDLLALKTFMQKNFQNDDSAVEREWCVCVCVCVCVPEDPRLVKPSEVRKNLPVV